MSHGTQVILSRVALRAAPIHLIPTAHALDSWMLFGFTAAVMFLSSLSTHGRSIPIFGTRGVCLGALAVFGFEQGTWPLGMVLFVMSIRQGIELMNSLSLGSWGRAATVRRRGNIFTQESRTTRLFGSDAEGDRNSRSARSRPLDGRPDYDDPLN